MMHMGDILCIVGVFSTAGLYHDACGGDLNYRRGVQYFWGYHDKCGGYLEYRQGVQYRRGIS